MIDLHAHILSETDDGATSFAESVALLFEAKKAGFTGIVCTPHYKQGYYEKDVNYIKDRIKELGIDSKRIGVHLYQGNEVYAATEIMRLLEEGKIASINKSKYIMIEFPITETPMPNYMEVIDRIVQKDYIPIIAHPEKYPYIQKDIKFAKELLNRGALLQASYASISGYYGGAAKKILIKMLKNDMIQFLGSDTHRKRTIYREIDKYVNEYFRYISEDKFDELSYKNPIKVIHNGKIIINK